MELYLVLDLSVSVAQNVDSSKCKKVQRALNFAERFINDIDKKEISVNLIYLIGTPILAKSKIADSSLVRSLFKSALVPKQGEIRTTAADYKALRNLIMSHKTAYTFEVLVVTDLSEEVAFLEELRMPCLLRFVILTDFNDEEECLSEVLVATLECISLNCGVDAKFAQIVTDLDGELHFPMMIGDYKDEYEMAVLLAKEKRTVKGVTITLSPTITLKATISPGLPKRLVVIDEEMMEREVISNQPPVFKFVGPTPLANIVKLNTTSLTFEVCPRNGESQLNTDAFRKLFDALVETKTAAILVHSSGEECYLRPLKFLTEGDCALILQFYAAQYVDWRSANDPQTADNSQHQFSYKLSSRLYWNETPDLQTDINRVVRRLKKDANPVAYYDDLRVICEFAIACGLNEFASKFAHLLEKRARNQEIANSTHLINVLAWLRSPDGFNVAAGELTKIMQL